MEKTKIILGMWLWRKLDGYFNKFDNPCLVTNISPNEIKLKMFLKSGDAVEIILKTDIELIEPQYRQCNNGEVESFFNKQLFELNKQRDVIQQKINKFEEIISSVL